LPAASQKTTARTPYPCEAPVWIVDARATWRGLARCRDKTLSSRDPSYIHNARNTAFLLTRKHWETASALFAHSTDQDRYPERTGLRGVPAHGITLGASTTLPRLRPRRLRRDSSAISTTSKSISQARHRTTVQSCVSSEIEFDREIAQCSRTVYKVCAGLELRCSSILFSIGDMV
jgi:hypothetical protein